MKKLFYLLLCISMSLTMYAGSPYFTVKDVSYKIQGNKLVFTLKDLKCHDLDAVPKNIKYSMILKVCNDNRTLLIVKSAPISVTMGISGENINFMINRSRLRKIKGNCVTCQLSAEYQYKIGVKTWYKLPWKQTSNLELIEINDIIDKIDRKF